MIEILDLFGKESGKLISTEGAEKMWVTAPKHEEGACILIKNNGAGAVEVTVKAGNSIYATDDLRISLEGEAVGVISLKNTGRFKNVSGENSGKIMLEISGNASETEVSALYL